MIWSLRLVQVISSCYDVLRNMIEDPHFGTYLYLTVDP